MTGSLVLDRARDDESVRGSLSTHDWDVEGSLLEVEMVDGVLDTADLLAGSGCGWLWSVGGCGGWWGGGVGWDGVGGGGGGGGGRWGAAGGGAGNALTVVVVELVAVMTAHTAGGSAVVDL